jgi:hypothetical protein
VKLFVKRPQYRGEILGYWVDRIQNIIIYPNFFYEAKLYTPTMCPASLRGNDPGGEYDAGGDHFR